MSEDNRIPEARIGKDQDGCWTIALADQFGWVTDTGEPLPADVVATWTPLTPVPAVARGERIGAMKGGTVFEWVNHMVAEYTAEVGSPPPPDIVVHITVAVLREMGWEKRNG